MDPKVKKFLVFCFALCLLGGIVSAVWDWWTAPAQDLISETRSQTPYNAAAPAAAAPTTSVPLGKQNALRSALNYLKVMPFSYKGLVDQLLYEGYTEAEAYYAVDNCGANWYEQAKRAAKKYLDVMPFSQKGLIEQLEYEGYTHDEAVYGVLENGL